MTADDLDLILADLDQAAEELSDAVTTSDFYKLSDTATRLRLARHRINCAVQTLRRLARQQDTVLAERLAVRS